MARVAGYRMPEGVYFSHEELPIIKSVQSSSRNEA
jgi:hypothetical protein